MPLLRGRAFAQRALVAVAHGLLAVLHARHHYPQLAVLQVGRLREPLRLRLAVLPRGGGHRFLREPHLPKALVVVIHDPLVWVHQILPALPDAVGVVPSHVDPIQLLVGTLDRHRHVPGKDVVTPNLGERRPAGRELPADQRHVLLRELAVLHVPQEGSEDPWLQLLALRLQQHPAELRVLRQGLVHLQGLGAGGDPAEGGDQGLHGGLTAPVPQHLDDLPAALLPQGGSKKRIGSESMARVRACAELKLQRVAAGRGHRHVLEMHQLLLIRAQLRVLLQEGAKVASDLLEAPLAGTQHESHTAIGPNCREDRHAASVQRKRHGRLLLRQILHRDAGRLLVQVQGHADGVTRLVGEGQVAETLCRLAMFEELAEVRPEGALQAVVRVARQKLLGRPAHPQLRLLRVAGEEKLHLIVELPGRLRSSRKANGPADIILRSAKIPEGGIHHLQALGWRCHYPRHPVELKPLGDPVEAHGHVHKVLFRCEHLHKVHLQRLPHVVVAGPQRVVFRRLRNEEDVVEVFVTVEILQQLLPLVHQTAQEAAAEAQLHAELGRHLLLHRLVGHQAGHEPRQSLRPPHRRQAPRARHRAQWTAEGWVRVEEALCRHQARQPGLPNRLPARQIRGRLEDINPLGVPALCKEDPQPGDVATRWRVRLPHAHKLQAQLRLRLVGRSGHRAVEALHQGRSAPVVSSQDVRLVVDERCHHLRVTLLVDVLVDEAGHGAAVRLAQVPAAAVHRDLFLVGLLPSADVGPVPL
mmetsp:Transcript_135182/g.320441  ORF Transcript_135182/g.320441 Transcript_135182/m.320441 type:complete len:755 (+) Transcript_135182:513-2777(+)